MLGVIALRPAPRPARRVAVVVALLVAAMTPAVALGDRAFDLRYANNVNGQITIAANTAMQCPTDTVDPLMNSGCEGARAGTNVRNNNSFDMQWLDIDSDPSTFSSSSAQLVLPTGARVLFAGLYWTGLQRKAETVTGANGFRGVPQDPPNAGAIGTVKMMVPRAGAYQVVNASTLDTAPIILNSGYGAFADVTAQVVAAGPGSYTVADIQTGTGGNSFAGWSLVVAYSDPAEPLRNLSVFDGLQVVNSSGVVDIPLSGFKTPTSGQVRTTVGVVASEGDAGATGDYLTVDEQRLTDAVHPSNNTENSTIANRGVLVTTKTPNWNNQLGYDSSLFAADGFLANGATSAMFRAKTTLDAYAPQAITFATELFSPDVELTKTSPAGQDFPGASKTYTITATNNGTGDATNVRLTDLLPPGVAYVSGPTDTTTVKKSSESTADTLVVYLGAGATSTAGGTLAPGASVTFSFTGTIGMSEPLGDVITNTATLDFVSADLGLPISVVADEDTTIRYPDPGIEKTLVSQSGTQYTFQLLVTNEGTVDTTGTVIVQDTIPGAGLVGSPSGTGWSCAQTPPATFSCTRSDALAAGQSYPPVTVTGNFIGGAAVTNTAVLSDGSGSEPDDPASPARLNNSSTVDAGLSPSAVLALNKSALTGTVSVGTLAGFRMEVRNTGPAAATNATLVDTLPAGLAYASYTTTQGSCSAAPGAGGTTVVSCALGTIAANGTVTVTIRARPQASTMGTTVTNTATASSEVTTSPATDTATLTIRPGADLAITKTASAPTVGEGGGIAYTVTMTNNGPASATNVQIVDRLPAAIDTAATITITPSTGGTCTRTDLVITCAWSGATASAATRSVDIAASMKTSGLTDAMRNAVNRANTFSSTDDPDPANNAAQATVVVTNAADMQVVAGGPSAVSAGGTGEISFTTTNNGPSTAVASSLEITVPAGLTPVSAPAGCTIAGQVVTCALGDVASGASTTTTVLVRAAADLVDVQSSASAVVSTATPDHVPTNDSDITPFILGPVADLVISKSASAATVAAGGIVDFTIAVTNNGPAPSNGAVMTDVLPAGLTPVSLSSSEPDACVITGVTITCQAGEIVPGGSYQVLVVAQTDAAWAGASITNTATLTPGVEADPNAGNNAASATVTVGPGSSGADLAVAKTVSRRTVAPGGTVRYAVTITNMGGTASGAATMTDTLPAGLSSAQATLGGVPCAVRGRGITCAVPVLRAGQSATANITARVGRDRAGATLANTARVSGAGNDVNPANDRATVRSRVTTSRATRATLAISARIRPAVVRRGQPVVVSARVRTLSGYPANTVRTCLSVPRDIAYRSSSGTRRGNLVCWTRDQLRTGSAFTVSYRAVARRSAPVAAVGTAVAGNALPVARRATAGPIGVTG